MTKIDPGTYDETIRRPWFVPGAHERRDENLGLAEWPAAEGEAGAELMFSRPLVDTTQFQQGPSASLGFKLAGAVLFGVAVGAVCVAVFG